MILEKAFLALKMNANKQQKSWMVHSKENGIRQFVPRGVFGNTKMSTGISTRPGLEINLVKQFVEEAVSASS